jgi:hypothetical protein
LRQEGAVRSIGFRFDKDSFRYVVLESSASGVSLLDAAECRADAALSGSEKLRWFGRELHAVLDKHAVDSAAFRAMENHNASSARIAPRAEVEGVAQYAALEHPSGVPLNPVRLVRIKSKFSVRTKGELDAAIETCYPPGLAKRYQEAFCAAFVALE